MNSFVLSGKITEGGKLMISNDPEYFEFLNLNRNCRVSINVQAISDNDPKLSEWYFENIILPKMQKGYLNKGNEYTIGIVRLEIMRSCPYYDLNQKQDTRWYNKVIEWCKRYAAENLDIIIND